MSKIIVGILQEEYGIDPLENYEKSRRIIESSFREADIIILPEYSMIDLLGGLTPEQVYSRAEKIDDSIYLSKFSDLSGNLGVPILLHFIEKSDSPPKAYSSSIIVEPSGTIHKVYSKIHLFDAYGYRESDYLLPGNKPSKTLVIGDFKINVAICYDIRFPELFRLYAENGSDLVLLHAGWVRGPLKEEALDFLAKARGHENTMYIVISNHTGRKYTGRSGVYDPYGVKRVDMGTMPGYIEYPIDLELVEEARSNIPVLRHREGKWSIKFIGGKTS